MKNRQPVGTPTCHVSDLPLHYVYIAASIPVYGHSVTCHIRKDALQEQLILGVHAQRAVVSYVSLYTYELCTVLAFCYSVHLSVGMLIWQLTAPVLHVSYFQQAF